MYSIEALWRGINNPKLILRELNVFYHTRLGLRDYNTSGGDVLSEDWDNLIILDACRYDLFEHHHTLPGKLESRISRGSSTPEFLDGNFRGKELHDTVYVNANPFVQNLDLGMDLHRLVNMWQGDGWSEEHGTVPPETIKEKAIEVADDYPNKRLIVHFMQPHYPFIGAGTETPEALQAGVNDLAPWRKLFLGQDSIKLDVIYSSYKENLDYVLPHIEKLLEVLEGRTVVTSDHGNMLGERAFPIPITEWGHPRGNYLTPLVKVPWLIHDSDERRDIVAEEPNSGGTESINEEEVKRKLRGLGYA